MSVVPAPRTASSMGESHLGVPMSVRSPVVVEVDDRYLWAFDPRRDGTPDGFGARRVTWPAALRPLLDETARVRLRSHDGGEVHFDDAVGFRGNPEPLRLTDRHGHPLAVDKVGHLTRTFADTDVYARRRVALGTAQALADLRDQVGVDAHLSYGALLGAVREQRMIGHDSDTDLAYLSRHEHPADVMRES